MFVTSEIHLIARYEIHQEIHSLHYAACQCKAFLFCVQKPGVKVNNVADKTSRVTRVTLVL